MTNYRQFCPVCGSETPPMQKFCSPQHQKMWNDAWELYFQANRNQGHRCDICDHWYRKEDFKVIDGLMFCPKCSNAKSIR